MASEAMSAQPYTREEIEKIRREQSESYAAVGSEETDSHPTSRWLATVDEIQKEFESANVKATGTDTPTPTRTPIPTCTHVWPTDEDARLNKGSFILAPNARERGVLHCARPDLGLASAPTMPPGRARMTGERREGGE